MIFQYRPFPAFRAWRVVLPMAALLALWPFALAAQSPEPLDQGADLGQTADAIIARVNGEALLLSRLKEAAFDQSIPLASLMADGIRSDGYRRAITLLVDQTLLMQKATEEGIEIDEMKITQVVDGMIDSLRQQLGGDAGVERFLEDRHLRLADLRELFRQRERRAMLIAQLVTRNVRTDNQRLEEFIAEREAAGLPVEEVNLAQVLVMARPGDRGSEKGRERYERAIFVARQAGKNPENFANLAAEYSDEPLAAETGGHIGWVDPGKLRPALSERLKPMKTGEISEPVETDLGYHILLLLGRRTSRDLLFAEEFQRERDRLVRQLRAEASIQLFDLEGRPLGRLALDEPEETPETAPEPLATPN